MKDCPACKHPSLLPNGLCLKWRHNTQGEARCARCGKRMNSGGEVCGGCNGASIPVIPGLNALSAFDDLDTRKEVCRLLDLIGQDGRTRFLLWCVDMVRKKAGLGLILDKPPQDSYGCLLDICVMVMQYGLDPKLVLEKLEQFARRKPL